ncbi:DUF4870 family protein [Thalassotalea piscium]
MSEVVEQEGQTTAGTAKIVYILYMVGVVFGITGIVGVVMAYINKNDAPDWLQSHYQFQIRTFWIGALYIVIGSILSVILIGWLVLLFWVIWLIVRCVKGMKSLDAKMPHPNPTGWMF